LLGDSALTGFAAADRPGHRVARLGLAALALALAATPAWAGDPTRTYRTIETDHFVIYYYLPLDDVARRVGVVAERAHRTLSPALDHQPDAKTIIVVVDDTDSANGFASVLPRNTIQVYATGPTGFNELEDHEDWLYGLVAHEYTHILHPTRWRACRTSSTGSSARPGRRTRSCRAG